MTVQGTEIYAFLGCAAIPVAAQPLNPEIVMVEGVLKKSGRVLFSLVLLAMVGWN